VDECLAGSAAGKRSDGLVCGIETFLDVMEPAEAQHFLKSRVKPFVQEFQTRWDQRGLVFGFAPMRDRLS